MPPRPWLLRLMDMIDAAEFVIETAHGLTYEQFEADRVRRDAVRFNMMIIGEAAGTLPADLQARHPQVPWQEMRGMRNIIAHSYFSVSDIVIWDTIEQELPAFVEILRTMLDEAQRAAASDAAEIDD